MVLTFHIGLAGTLASVFITYRVRLCPVTVTVTCLAACREVVEGILAHVTFETFHFVFARALSIGGVTVDCSGTFEIYARVTTISENRIDKCQL